ncbi:unnamed protein product [Rotaria magnacalcarata]
MQDDPRTMKTLMPFIRRATRQINQHSPSSQRIVYRGMTLTNEQCAFFTVNKIFRFPGFTSTSEDQNVAQQFGNVLLEIEVPHPCYQVRNISHISYYQSEREWLFSPYSQFQVMNRNNNTIYLRSLDNLWSSSPTSTVPVSYSDPWSSPPDSSDSVSYSIPWSPPSNSTNSISYSNPLTLPPNSTDSVSYSIPWSPSPTSIDPDINWRSELMGKCIVVIGIIELVFTILIFILELASLNVAIGIRPTGVGIWCAVVFAIVTIITIGLGKVHKVQKWNTDDFSVYSMLSSIFR